MAIRGSQQVALGPVEYIWVAKLDANGVPKGITGTIAAGSDAGFRRVKGLVSLGETIPEVTYTPYQGDNRTLGHFVSRPSDVVKASLGLIVLDQVMEAALDGRSIYTLGSWEVSQRTVQCMDLQDLAIIVNGKARSHESGSSGQEGWYTILYYNVNMQKTGLTLSGENGTASQNAFAAVANEVDTSWWEELFTTNYGVDVAYASDPIIADYPITGHTYVSDGSTSESFTVDETPAAADAASNQLWEDGSIETYTTNFTVTTATKTIALVTDPANNSDNFLLYEFVPDC
jgi:hypothetical protein